MKRPSFQFYPADWRNNANLRRCSLAARGAWVELMCLFADSDEFGLLRWPLEEISQASAVPMEILKELVAKTVLKGADSAFNGFQHTTSHARQVGGTYTLIEPSSGPVWFSSRMVTDEWLRGRQGASTRFTAESQPSRSPTRRQGERQGDGATSTSSSTSTIRQGGAVAPVRMSFQKPTKEELYLEVGKIGLPQIEADRFFNYYEANGWRVGKNPMKNWRSALVGWKLRWQENNGHAKSRVPGGNF